MRRDCSLSLTAYARQLKGKCSLGLKIELMRVWWINDKIRDIRDSIEALAGSVGARAIVYDKERVQTSGGYGMEDVLSEVADLEVVLKRLDRQRYNASKRLYRFMEDLPPGQRSVMIHRYLNGLAFSGIAAVMHKSEAHIYSMHGKALKNLDKKLAIK